MMRSAWQEHIAETRRKGNRGKRVMTHKEAMKVASVTWAKKKAKLLRKTKKAQKRNIVSVAKPPQEKIVEKSVESESS